jgi:beta-mannosidase
MTAPLTGIRVDAHGSRLLHEGWSLAPSAPGAFDAPDAAMEAALSWRPALVPGTVADSFDTDLETTFDCDAEDWWYRCAFESPTTSPGEAHRLRFDGLATLAEVWLNGTRLFGSRNMFVPRVCDIPDLLAGRNELVICFRSVKAECAKKKPRPRWKTALVSHQNLRWIRATLLGRIPAWTPAIPPVGPWKNIALETLRLADPTRLDLQTSAKGSEGRISLDADLRLLGGWQAQEAALRVGEQRFPLLLERSAEGLRVSGAFTLPRVPLWSPHTHGAPHLLECAIELRSGDGAVEIACGRIGFKSILLDRRNGAVQLVVNGRSVFCRGACWTANDFRSLAGDPDALRRALTLARDGGVNMLRVGGTMVYESEAFYSLCDELGILVWQDFMFANMDYPFTDEAFHLEVEAEAAHQLNRFQRHPCIAVYCGGSEIEQQAAMLGLPPADWTGPFFTEELPALCAASHPDIPYFPSSPTGGVLPFHLSTGISHYYGVGAYKRPLEDVKRAGVKFTPECLGFSNVPETGMMERLSDGALPAPHHPRWKAGVPRDSGAGWDFEDIRDHYLRLLARLDPVELRSRDLERYYALSRAVSGEVMKTVFSEWRRPGSGCGGGLVWFFKDLRPGAGWGLLDSAGQPKAPYWYLKRAWARQALLMTDEGLEGLQLHLLNETPEDLEATLELDLFQAGKIGVGHAAHAVTIPAFGGRSLQADALLPYFADLTYAYRFGPPRHDAVVARLAAAKGGRVLSEDFHFPLGLSLPLQESTGITATAEALADGVVVLTIQSPVLLQTVSLACDSHLPDDNYFHLAPGRSRRVRFTPAGGSAPRFKVHLAALNLRDSITVRTDG